MVSTEYLAGFFDGEGSIGIYCRGDGLEGMYLVVSLVGTDMASVDLFRKRYGGVLHSWKPIGGRRMAWQWAIRNYAALEALRDLIPHLRVKRSQARIALLMPLVGNGNRLTAAQKRRRVALAQRLRVMKRAA